MIGVNPEFPSSKSVLISLSLYIQKFSVNQRLAHSSALKPEASLFLLPRTLSGRCSCAWRAVLVHSAGSACTLKGTRSWATLSPHVAIVRIPRVRRTILITVKLVQLMSYMAGGEADSYGIQPCVLFS